MPGLGSAPGATALVSAVIVLLGQIEFIPILGDLARSLIPGSASPVMLP